ncbi:MAG: aminotransferase class I/II-fold pyridoxal phosphate-dependent enzyme, partial [Candidatus Aureabacteria bacterium]|nr:aminotransferase class I/II-fold pyridoxal phosphate-dependent enzyme [Candidatus Auribacterota bacterium]
DMLKRARLMHINYPNNPTAAVATKDFFRQVIDFANEHNIIVCHDAAYTEIAYDGYQAPSFLEIDGAKDVGIEFHSFSKTYNMTGWRIAFAVGNGNVISGLAKVKSNMDSGIFQSVQYAGIEAMKLGKEFNEERNKIYQERRDVFVDGLKEMGFDVAMPKATFYVWFPVPKGFTSKSFAMKVLTEAHVVITPGNGFGQYGEGYVRAAMTVDVDRIQEAVDRIRKVL